MFRMINNYIKNNSKVVSLEFGVGRIINKFKMYDGIDDYLEVQYQADGKSRFFCIKNLNDVRLLSSKEAIENALQDMSEKLNDVSIQNDIDELSIRFNEKNVIFIAARIVDLLRREELSTKETILLNLTIESLVFEIEEVYCVDVKSARGIVSDYLKSA